jgi:hypothetical protein
LEDGELPYGTSFLWKNDGLPILENLLLFSSGGFTRY